MRLFAIRMTYGQALCLHIILVWLTENAAARYKRMGDMPFRLAVSRGLIENCV